MHRGHRVGAIATDDTHARPDVNDFMRGWVQVKASELSPEALLNALKAGHYYASTGAALHNVEFIGRDKLLVECAPATYIYLNGEGAGVLGRANGTWLTRAEFDISDVGIALAARDRARRSGPARLDQPPSGWAEAEPRKLNPPASAASSSR